MLDRLITRLFGRRRPIIEVDHIRVLTLEPGDIIVISCDGPIKDDLAAQIKQHIEKRFAPHSCMVFGDGLKFSVVRMPATPKEHQVCPEALYPRKGPKP
jgi:hypothetical protein